MRKLVLATLAAALLAGCGFHLRGSGGLALAEGTPVAFEAQQPESELARLVKRKLEGARLALVAADQAAGARSLRLGPEQLVRRELTVNAQGRVAEYELSLSVDVALAAPGAEARSTTLSARREYTYDQTRVLSVGEQENFLLADLRRDLADQLMRRLERIGR